MKIIERICRKKWAEIVAEYDYRVKLWYEKYENWHLLADRYKVENRDLIKDRDVWKELANEGEVQLRELKVKYDELLCNKITINEALENYKKRNDRM